MNRVIAISKQIHMEPEQENGSGPRPPIKPFLRNGQGTARFGMSSMPSSASTLDSGYSNEDETRPPTTASLPLDRDPNSPSDPQNRQNLQNLQNPRSTPMVEEADEEEAAAQEHSHADELISHETCQGCKEYLDIIDLKQQMLMAKHKAQSQWKKHERHAELLHRLHYLEQEIAKIERSNVSTDDDYAPS